nr:hypothetical protein CFP56_30332 [Quercus suber]
MISVTSILGGASDNTGSGIARRLVLKTVSVCFWASYIFSLQTRVSSYFVPELITWAKSKVGPTRKSPQNLRQRLRRCWYKSKYSWVTQEQKQKDHPHSRVPGKPCYKMKHALDTVVQLALLGTLFQKTGVIGARCSKHLDPSRLSVGAVSFEALRWYHPSDSNGGTGKDRCLFLQVATITWTNPVVNLYQLVKLVSTKGQGTC